MDKFGPHIYTSFHNILQVYKESAHLLRDIDNYMGGSGFNPQGGRGSDVFGHNGSHSYEDDNYFNWLPHYIQRCWEIDDSLIGVRILFHNYWDGILMKENRPYIFLTNTASIKAENTSKRKKDNQMDAVIEAFKESFCFVAKHEPLVIDYTKIGKVNEAISQDKTIKSTYIIEYLEEINSLEMAKKKFRTIGISIPM